ncbi:hypothetical protein D3C81_1305370 [compost metagenome]
MGKQVRRSDVQVQIAGLRAAAVGPEFGADGRGLTANQAWIGRVGVVVKRMILQLLADWQRCHHGNLQCPQIGIRTNAGTQQNRRTAIAARAKNDLSGAQLRAVAQLHSDRALTVEQDLIHQAVRADV